MKSFIKICGITNFEDAEIAVQYGVNAIGFNLFNKSKRLIPLDKIVNICNDLSDDIEVFLLFVNQEKEFVADCLKKLPTAIPQFHGDETKEYCESFGRDYVKAIRVNKDTDLEKINHDYKSAKMLIFDSYDEVSYGGTGKSFDLSLLNGLIEIPFLVAGGIDETNFHNALLIKNCSGVDICSGVEDGPGIKNHLKVKNIVEKVRSFHV
ncbi:phosphoribosylanthranilate isomerase [Gammaproteobacteria bacterium]|nr:phosphoribosylanthranilate isomerase [Gammaproteobacteria bacterium]